MNKKLMEEIQEMKSSFYTGRFNEAAALLEKMENLANYYAAHKGDQNAERHALEDLQNILRPFDSRL